MADGVEYWDTIYERPFVGKENVRAYFAKAAAVLGPSVRFVVDGLAPAEDGSAVGVKVRRGGGSSFFSFFFLSSFDSFLTLFRASVRGERRRQRRIVDAANRSCFRGSFRD